MARRREQRADKATFILRGDVALRLDALAWELWVESGMSTTKPTRANVLSVLVMRPERIKTVTVKLHRCLRCGLVYGAPWCWRHEDRELEPVSSEEDITQ